MVQSKEGTRPSTFLKAAGSLLLLGALSVPVPDGATSARTALSLNDDTISLAVESRLRTAWAVPFDRIDVRTTDGVVQLSGTVTHLLAKERAIALAQHIKGVRAVVDRISVEPLQAVPHEQLADRAKEALARDPAVDTDEVTVTVHDSVVRLTGRVDSWAERNLAEDVVKSVPGVGAVENRLDLARTLERPDAEIRNDVVRRLQSDVWVDADDVSVRVQEAVVHLSGTVPSAGQAERAKLLAWVYGVAEVRDDGLTVEWRQDEAFQRSPQSMTVSMLSDEAIKEAVRDALRHDPRVVNFNLGLRVNDGRVILTGVVDNLKAKRSAERDAFNTVGVWSVKNLLKVRPVEPSADVTIANDIRAAFLHDPALDRDDIAIRVIDGTVYLSGQVGSVFEKRHAEEVAAGVRGVVAVDNGLTVRSWPWDRDDDLALRQQIVEQLWWSPFVDSDQVHVSVEDGVATLSGTVSTWHERRVAEENAREGGAVFVENDLAVAGARQHGSKPQAMPDTKEETSS